MGAEMSVASGENPELTEEQIKQQKLASEQLIAMANGATEPISPEHEEVFRQLIDSGGGVNPFKVPEAQVPVGNGFEVPEGQVLVGNPNPTDEEIKERQLYAQQLTEMANGRAVAPLSPLHQKAFDKIIEAGGGTNPFKVQDTKVSAGNPTPSSIKADVAGAKKDTGGLSSLVVPIIILLVTALIIYYFYINRTSKMPSFEQRMSQFGRTIRSLRRRS
jgi:hypothetical protein